ncbi:MAG: hypothetical protein NWR73_01220, partial [Flavobacteriales bacterium]|nr:hypothetical protein [Flavobacteriales bacterium]
PGLYSGLECADENACNYNSLSTTNDDCLYISGCMDPEFCSYNANACIDTGCDENVSGCMEPNAINYNPEATCSEICNYEITGMVFHDQNQNGIHDEGEPLIPNQEFSFWGASQLSFFSDNSGLFSIELQDGLYWLSMPDNPAFPFITSHTFPFSFYSSELSTLNIGLDFELPEINIDVNISPAFGSLICVSTSPVYLFINNSSNVDLSGYIEMEFDDQYYEPVLTQYVDSVVGNKVYQSFATYPIWNLGFRVFYFTPLATIPAGTPTFLNAKVYTYYEDQFLGMFDDSWEDPVLCSYDPNDITVTPPGWNDPHFIGQEETLEYRIRFQNTGNFQAFTVLLRDTISEHLDLSTFELKAASHNVETMINLETRELVFTFNDINLPYEECCGDESIGQVIYEIKAYENLPANSLIENTAYIYFDNNEPIVTNTAFSTIYICPENLAEFTADAETLCLGNALNVEATQPWIETYSWTVNNAPNGAEQLNSIDFSEAGMYSINLTASNPFCSHSSAVDVEVLPLPTASFETNSNILSASDAANYQWFNNGIVIDGATDQTLEITEDGNYSVEATGDNGCVAMSDEVFVAYVGINEQWKENLSVFPIPVNKNDVLNIAGVNLAAITYIRIIDRAGKVVFESA